jgi:hypothetical protein
MRVVDERGRAGEAAVGAERDDRADRRRDDVGIARDLGKAGGRHHPA